jgi:hypothetical protein
MPKMTGTFLKTIVFVLTLLCCFSCSKYQDDDAPDPLIFISEGSQIKFPSYTVTAQDYCKQKLYTINTGQVMISFISDLAMTKGVYTAGLNYWGNYSEDIKLIVDNLKGDKITGSFSGNRSHGLLK